MAAVHKGKRGERELTRMLNEAFEYNHSGWYARRNLKQSRDSGHDIEIFLRELGGDDKLVGVVEVKRRKSATQAQMRQWWKQALKGSAEAFPGQTPLAILAVKVDRQKWRFRCSCEVGGYVGWIEVNWEMFLALRGMKLPGGEPPGAKSGG